MGTAQRTHYHRSRRLAEGENEGGMVGGGRGS